MSAKNNKRLILSGFLLIIAMVCYILYQELLTDCVSWYFEVLEHFRWNGWNTILFLSWLGVTINVIASFFMILYCFIPNKKALNDFFYFVGFGLFLFLNLYLLIVDLTGGNTLLYPSLKSNLFMVFILIFMLFAKFKNSKVISIIGFICFIMYLLMELASEFNYFNDVTPMVLFNIYLFTNLFAIFNIWLAETGNTLFFKKAIETIETPLEDNLVSLKQLYDSGAITEEEYNEKKTEILNKL